ncbi:Methylthioribulose-1-phosphate dehydratase [Dispira simplex]|nr:Methylthioribulose-1-phosphate dehydratase [Dispira simplex]
MSEPSPLNSKIPVATGPEHHIPELCRLFYQLGWMTGSGGALSIRQGDHIYITPSGLQKESLTPQDLFILDWATQRIVRAPAPPAKPSACTPLFFHCHSLPNANVCIHTHSQNAVLATLVYSGDVFEITGQEMIKGIRNAVSGRNHSNSDKLVVPIIENAPEEDDLGEAIARVIRRYPATCAVLVRRHGVFVWGPTWEKTKVMAECYDYLFEIAVKMIQAGLNPRATYQPHTVLDSSSTE